jgi:type I restriction enzyme S subunit
MSNVTLQEICHLVTDGKHGDCQEEDGSGYYFISCKDVRDGWVKYTGARQITEADYLDTHRRTQLEANDILITNSGTIGRMALVPRAPETGRTTFQKSVAIIKPKKDRVLPRWLYYYLMAEREALIAWAGGTAQKNLLLRDMRAFQVRVPSFPVQHKIVSILSAYDDLIENNLRRIKILEEMARLIYQEWFVKLRFPGHEKARMVDSELGDVPEGWEMVNMGAVLSTLESGSRPRGGIDPDERGVPSIGAENILGLGQYDYGKEKYVTREFFEGMRRGQVQSGDVLLYKDGAKIGRKSMFRNGFPHTICSINEHVFILRTNTRCTQNYLFFWLALREVTKQIVNLNTNAAQPGINQKGVKGLPIVLPPVDALEHFDNLIDPLLQKLFNLVKRNRILRQTRDLLLPKLISGEIDVGDLDIKTSEVEACPA